MALTSQIRYAKALDNAATDGSGKAALAFGDITAKYLRDGGTLTSLTTETITTLGTYQAPTSAAHIRIKELSSADPCKGVYEVHFHNTQLATGSKLWLFLSAAGAAFQPLEVDLTDVSGRLPAALTAGGNIKADALLLDGVSPLNKVREAVFSTDTGSYIRSNFQVFFSNHEVNTTYVIDDLALQATAAAIKTKTDFLPSATAGAAGGVFIAGSNAVTTVNITGNLSGSVGSVTALASGAIVVGAFASGAITADAIATDAIGSLELAAAASTEIVAALLATTNGSATVAAQLAHLDADVSDAGGGGDVNVASIDGSEEAAQKLRLERTSG